VEDLLRQAPAPCEILVVDQSDDVDPELAAFLEECQKRGNVRWLRQEKPNAQAARNRGIREAKGDVLLFLDDDIRCGPGLVGKHWRNYRDEKIAAVSGQILEPGQKPTSELSEGFYAKRLGWMHFPLNFATRTECINLSSCNCSVRTDVARAVGGFDENFVRTLFDDSDFSWRLHEYCQKKGLKVIHDPEASLVHLKVPSGGNRPGKRNEHVVADAACWQTWLYFHLQHWGWEAFMRLAKRYRWWIWHRKNIVRPWWLIVAHMELLRGILQCLVSLLRGRCLLQMRPGQEQREMQLMEAPSHPDV